MRKGPVLPIYVTSQYKFTVFLLSILNDILYNKPYEVFYDNAAHKDYQIKVFA